MSGNSFELRLLVELVILSALAARTLIESYFSGSSDAFLHGDQPRCSVGQG
ncbi:hypothetical protein ABZ897_31210 [Nonomuraea sp. NPDC046802]|uniref:hypothetical protein n=1 Tax=Nonomuraea sp. NPDC046802 TaxID=3154919 RepID=UPI0033DA2A26